MLLCRVSSYQTPTASRLPTAMRYDPKSFGKRLSEEVEKTKHWPVRDGKPLSLRDLEREVQVYLTSHGRPVTGSSRGNLSNWLRGNGPEEGEPRRNIVDALAAVFSSPGSTMRPEYLLYGGARTQEEAETEAEARARAPVVDVVRERVPVLERLPYRFTVALLDHAGLRAHTARTAAGPPRPASEQQEEVLAHLEEAWKDIARPLAGCRTLGDSAVFDYLDAAIHARNLALRIPTTDQEDTNG